MGLFGKFWLDLGSFIGDIWCVSSRNRLENTLGAAFGILNKRK